MARGSRRKQRPHKPREIGPRVYRRGRWYAADLRYLRKGEPTLRDPTHPRWPEGGRRTEDRDEALRWRWAYVDADEKPQAKAWRLGAARDAYLRHRERTVEARTVAGDVTALNHLAAHHVEHTRVSDIEVQPLVDELLDEGYKPITVRQYVIALRSFWRWMERPFPSVDLPRPGKMDVRYWTDAEIATLRKRAPKVHPDCLVALDVTLYLGLREGEMLGLWWEDLNGRSVRVQRQIPQGAREPKPLKGKKARTGLVLPGWTHKGASGYVLHRDGEPLTRSTVRGWIETLLEDTGLRRKGIAWHAGRHSYARMCLEAGVSLEQLKLFLGHASIQTTEGTYGHMRESVAIEMASRAVYG